MKTRIITSIVAVIGIFPFFWFSAPTDPSNPLNYLFPLLFAGVSFVSAWEMLHCLALDKKYAISVPLYFIAFAFPMLARVMNGNMREYVRIAVLVALIYAIYLFACIVFQFGKLDMGKIALLFMTSFYIVGANSAAIILRDTPSIGRYLFLIPFVLSWTTDIFAYFSGRLFGKHKLIEAVSPKKTVEGAIGGFVCCSLMAILYGLIVGKCFVVTPNYIALGLGGMVIGIVAQIGDLVMSAIKRQYGIKDYGYLLPGHGGVLDRFDSVIVVAPLTELLLALLPVME